MELEDSNSALEIIIQDADLAYCHTGKSYFIITI